MATLPMPMPPAPEPTGSTYLSRSPIMSDLTNVPVSRPSTTTSKAPRLIPASASTALAQLAAEAYVPSTLDVTGSSRDSGSSGLPASPHASIASPVPSRSGPMLVHRPTSRTRNAIAQSRSVHLSRAGSPRMSRSGSKAGNARSDPRSPRGLPLQVGRSASQLGLPRSGSRSHSRQGSEHGRPRTQSMQGLVRPPLSTSSSLYERNFGLSQTQSNTLTQNSTQSSATRLSVQSQDVSIYTDSTDSVDAASPLLASAALSPAWTEALDRRLAQVLLSRRIESHNNRARTYNAQVYAHVQRSRSTGHHPGCSHHLVPLAVAGQPSDEGLVELECGAQYSHGISGAEDEKQAEKGLEWLDDIPLSVPEGFPRTVEEAKNIDPAILDILLAAYHLSAGGTYSHRRRTFWAFIGLGK